MALNPTDLIPDLVSPIRDLRHGSKRAWLIGFRGLSWALLLMVLISGCSLNSSKKQYVLAETLWTDGNYTAAVSEFEKVHSLDPHGKLGLQALFRAATTQAFFLSQYQDAIHKFQIYAQVSQDKGTARQAELLIGDLLYSKLEHYNEAIQHYQALLNKNPNDPDAALFLYRIGKSQFYLWKFNDSVATYQKLIQLHPSSTWAEKAAYEIGVSEYTRGEQSPDTKAGGRYEPYKAAIQDYQAFLKKYPKSRLVPEAKFGIASCLEEMNDLDGAYKAFEALQSTYPSPNVIKVKLVRIHERQKQRNR